MSHYGGDGLHTSGGRVKGVTIVRPILFGNLARYFGKKREEDGHTHAWTAFLRPFKNEDLSVWIDRVQFKLHDSYPNPLRVISKPPFEVAESGWGEFEISIKIYFKDPAEKPVVLYHLLKLFQSDLGKKNLVSESYDEIIFTDPTALMHQCLTSTHNPSGTKAEPANDYAEVEEKCMEKISSAHKKIKQEISELHSRIQSSKYVMQQLNTAIAQLEQQQQQQHPQHPGVQEIHGQQQTGQRAEEQQLQQRAPLEHQQLPSAEQGLPVAMQEHPGHQQHDSLAP